jgi:hypothetical protein
VATRRIFASIVLSLFLILIVLTFVAGSWARPGPRKVAGAILAFSSAYGLALVLWVRARPLPTETPEKLVAGFRGAFFIGLGVAEAPALVGFAGSFITMRLWPYLIGLAVSLGLMAAIAPTRSEIERRQRQIEDAGSALSLGQLLTQRPAAGGRGTR